MKQTLIIFLYAISFFSCKEEKNKIAEHQLTTENLKENIDDYFSALNTIGKFNGVIYASKNNAKIISKAYNLKPNNNSSTYVSTESQFDIHSVSKLMAHYLIEKFELEGKVKKTQTLNDFIPSFPNGEKITIDMLLHHTSGLPRSFDNIEGDEINLTSKQIIAYTKKQKLIFAPGTASQYSNVGYELVYYIIQEISNKTFAQCLTDELFKPLKMKNSGAHFYTKEKNIKHLAKNHEKQDTLITQVDNILKDELKTARIFSTVNDLNIFLNHINKEPYASLLKTKDNVIEKSGGSDGIRVEIYTNLEYNYNYILLANYEEIPFQQTVIDFTKILENKPYDIPKELNRQPIDLQLNIIEKYIGSYSFADMGNLELTFKVEDGNLVVYQDGENIAILKAETENTFFDDPKEPESFEFIDDKNGSFNVLMGWKGVKLKGLRNNTKKF
ncbi:serine hydrolase [uncultured Lacinutrix sp.]|uniref:serine hydrolase domain-containing protein n=1 Tax=uncultured Lacinutrix sp. TaxID=574032 RepID=UPI0026395067|nr:serine hydrolase domain-containing protein [uncultured Lacinutrix sp.]